MRGSYLPLPLALLALLGSCSSLEVPLKQFCDPTTNGTIYDYSAQVLNGPLKVDFSDFRGKFVLFVNVATY
ncbi:hypothetical protein fugu_013358 [Takifugu bimaculatus]|uniref:Glutathione peroxidase n=2 Tax=Takifugu TaxID=31032 RepID=A0A4Z2C355_9TELE|nr:hypothetical protein fugu_013358 [Takifugu bimaculatus]